MSTTARSAAARQPVVYLSHGAPPLADDQLGPAELAAWSDDLPRPSAILVVSAHWELAPIAVSATTGDVPLLYDFWGFPQHYYEVTYDAPGAPVSPGRWRGCSPVPARPCTRTPPAGSTTAPTCR